MKKTALLLAAIAGVLNARADLVFSDGFTYPDGNLVGAVGSPWVAASSGAGNGPVQVINGEIEISRSQSEDVNVTLAGGAFATSGPVTALYASFKIIFTDLPSPGGSYFAHLNTSGTRCRVWAATTNAASGTFRLGVGNSTSATATSGQIATDLSLDTDYEVVVRYELATGLSTIWLNPSSEDDPGVAATDSPSATSISAFAFRQTGGIGIMLIDNLIIGTTFADVVGGNLPPTISPIATQSIPANAGTGPIPFVVGDDQTPAEDLSLSGSSDNPTLVPEENIIFDGTGANRTVTVTSAAGQQGQANITITAGDGTASTDTTFLLKVGAPSVAPVANQISPVNTVFGLLGITIADAEENEDSLQVTAISSNQLLVPNSNFTIGGTGANRTLTLVPATDETGLTTITITVDDGHQTASTSFALTVHPTLGLLVADDFNRDDGPLVDNVNWFSHSGLYGEMSIVQNKVVLSQAASEDLNLHLTPNTLYPETDGYVFYASLVANFSELPAGTGTYFAHFKDDSIGYRARVFATTTGAAEGTFRFGISSADGDVTIASFYPVDLSLNTDYLVIVRFNAATGESRLWVDPTSESTAFVDSTDVPLSSPIESFAFRQAGPSNGMGVLTVDDVRIGTSFLDVAVNLPTPINYTLNNKSIRLSWPSGQGFNLRRTTSLPPTGWSDVPFVNEGSEDVSNIDVSTGAGFFRLEKIN